MAIGDDFGIDYVNKRIYHAAGTTVYTVNDLYSWLMDTFDELTQMDDPVPMSAQTPTEYTIINGWFLDEGEGSFAHKYLSGGAIKTDGYNGKIQFLKLDGVTADPVSSDIGKKVKDDGVEIGELLGYLIDPFGVDTGFWWIRSTATIADNSVMTITDGTGAGTANGNSTSGENLYANVYTLGTIESAPAPQIYIFQAGEAIAEWSHLSNWDRGHIDVLLKVKEAGAEIDGAVVTVFARQAGDEYSHYAIDLSAGGRNAVPLSTKDDLNEDTPEYYLLYDAETAPFTTIGQIVKGATSGATAELVAVTDWGTTGLLSLRGVKDTFQDNETITGSADGSATVNGTVGDTFLAYDNETANFLTLGQVITGATSGAKRILRGVQDDGTTGKLVMQVSTTVTGSARNPYYKAFQDNETISGATDGSALADGASTTIKSGWNDITVAFVNGTVTVGTITGTFIPCERVTYTGGEAILLKAETGQLTLGNVTNTSLNGKTITGDLSGASCTATANLSISNTINKAFEQQPAYPYAVVINAGSIYETARPLAQVYEYLKFITQEDSKFKMYPVETGNITVLDGEEYIVAASGYSPVVAAPFGTFAGGKYFGAQGVWVEGMPSGQSYQFTDSNGVIRQPYLTVTIAVTSLATGDRVCVFRTEGGVIDEDIYTSHATANTVGSSTFKVTTNIATDTPAEGVLRVVDVSENKKHRMRYASWSGDTFTLPTARTGTQTGSQNATVLVDSSATFITWGILNGDIIRNTTDSSWAQVATVDSETQLTTTRLTGGTDNLWQTNDGYSIHTLPVTYTSSDTAYVPFIDKTATGTSVEQAILYSVDRPVLIRVRKKGILPFETTGTVGDKGLSVSAIRTADSIVT